MSKKVYDWENDSDLKTNNKVVNMPLNNNIKGDQIIDALEHGYKYSEKGLLTKEITVEVSQEENEPIYYDSKNIKIDEKGRKYFYDQNRVHHYIDDNGNMYSISISATGEEREYITTDSGPLFFTDNTHQIAISPEGWTYSYDPETRDYVYDPNIIQFKGR